MEDTSDTTVTLFGVVTAVGLLMAVVFPFLLVVSIPLALVINLVGAAVYILGMDQLIAVLSMRQTPLIAYLTGPDPDRIPRWVYIGLAAGGLTLAGSATLLYYGTVAPHNTAGWFDLAGSWALLVLGGGVFRYPMTFLWEYWREV